MRIGTLSLYGLDNTVLTSLRNLHEQSCILGSFERKRYDEVLGVEIVSILELEETLVIKYFKPLILDINKTRITGSKKID